MADHVEAVAGASRPASHLESAASHMAAAVSTAESSSDDAHPSSRSSGGSNQTAWLQAPMHASIEELTALQNQMVVRQQRMLRDLRNAEKRRRNLPYTAAAYVEHDLLHVLSTKTQHTQESVQAEQKRPAKANTAEGADPGAETPTQNV